MKVEDLKNTKIYLSNEEDRVKFQEKVFKLWVKWSEGDQSVVENTNGDMFFTVDNYLHLFLDWGKTSFINNRSKQIFLDEVLAIEEPKIDFKPFDKVLVRDYMDTLWKPRLFAWYDVDYNENYPYPFETTDGDFYRYCIPYDENLANTTKSKDE